MRILYIDQTAELGGAELSLFAEVRNLPHHASVVLFQDGRFREMLEQAGLPVEIMLSPVAARVIKKKSGLLCALAAVPSVVGLVLTVAARAQRHDLIYANSQKAFVVGAFAAALTRKRLIWRLRDVLDKTHFNRNLIRIVVLLANWKAGAVIANSGATGRAFGEAGGDMSRLFVAYPGIDEGPFDEVTQAQIAVIHEVLGVGDAKLVGVFGRLSAWKGQDVFVEALARVPGVVGVIVGGALFNETAFEQTLRQKIVDLGIQERVRLLGFRDDIPALMRTMDVIVHCSVAAEPFGRVVVEGMLSGKPVVASRAGGVMEIIEDGVSGYLVEPGNINSLAAAIELAAAGGAAVTAVSMAGRDRARSQFTVAATMRQIQAALESFS